MVSLTLMARLLEALAPDARLVLVGDPDQLASVEAGAVLGDLVDARPTVGAGAPGPLRAPWTPRSTPSGATARPGANGVGAGCARSTASSGGDRRARRRGPGRRRRGGARPAARRAVAGVRLPRGRRRRLAGRAAPRSRCSVPRSRARARGRDRGARGRRGDRARTRSTGTGCCARTGAARRRPALGRAGRALARRPRAGDTGRAARDGRYAGRPLLVTANDYETGLYNGDTGVVVVPRPGRDRSMAAFRRGGDPVLRSPARSARSDRCTR